MKQYSVDLRERLLGAIDAGLSQPEASRLFGVATSTIKRGTQQRASTGCLVPKPRADTLASHEDGR
jgi:transposase